MHVIIINISINFHSHLIEKQNPFYTKCLATCASIELSYSTEICIQIFHCCLCCTVFILKVRFYRLPLKRHSRRVSRFLIRPIVQD